MSGRGRNLRWGWGSPEGRGPGHSEVLGDMLAHQGDQSFWGPPSEALQKALHPWGGKGTWMSVASFVSGTE